ncbi:Protein trichome birefringence-like 38, partial [Linum perenne]
SPKMVTMLKSCRVPMVVWWSSLTCFLALVAGGRSNDVQCNNLYDGIWVLDKAYPLYNSSTCPFIRKEFDCLKYGRLDSEYLHYRWQPSGNCILPSWKYIQDGKTISKDMNRMTAFSIAMKTWARWVDLSVNTTKTTIFFQGVSPAHYHGIEWGEPGVTNCAKETKPIPGPTRAVMPLALKVQEEVIATIKKQVYFLNITSLSFMRKDGHPSSHNGLHGMDCTHWCVAGVPDTWNQLLSSILIG